MRRQLKYPVVYLDFNDRVGFDTYFFCSGSHASFTAMGLSLDQAVGKRFTFWMDEGSSDDVIAEGVVIEDARWQYLADIDREIGYFSRADLEAHRSEI